MKVLSILFLSALACAAPADKGEDKGMIQIMVQCLAENWKDGKVEDCINCWKDLDKAGSPEEGLKAGKKCAADYLPRANKDCSTEIAALVPGQEPKEVMECFENSLMTMSSESCLEMAGKNEDVQETFTEGALCMVEGAKNVTKWVKKSLGIKGNPMKMKKMLMPLLTKAHCDNANDNDNDVKECTKCFRVAVKSGKGRRKSRMVAALKSCSEKHLGDTYKECTNMVGNKGKGQGKLVKKCFSKVLIRSVVESCDKGATSADPAKPEDVKTFMEVLDCGKETVKEWVKNNANKKMADKLTQLLDD